MKLWLLCLMLAGSVLGCDQDDWQKSCVCLTDASSAVDDSGDLTEEPVTEPAPACPSLDLFAIFPSLTSADSSEISSDSDDLMAPVMDFTLEPDHTESVPANDPVIVAAAMDFTQDSAEQTPQTERQTESGCVDINVADQPQLMRLPGVGSGRAQAIIAARQKRPFKRKKDITRIKGIGQKSYKKMADSICEI